MICQRCLSRLSQRRGAAATHTSHTTILYHPARRTVPTTRSPHKRPFSHSSPKHAPSAVTAENTTSSSPRNPGLKPAATSTAAAQPFSTPLSPSPAKEPDLPIEPAQTKTLAPKVQSSVQAGTVLKGLNFLKDGSDPIAKPDNEYPAWLWDVLNKKDKDGVVAKSGSGDGEGDLFSKSRKQRRLAAKALRRKELEDPASAIPAVPVHAQSVDLPRGDGSLQGAHAAAQARAELTQALRDKRRSKIKEDNFLREMS